MEKEELEEEEVEEEDEDLDEEDLEDGDSEEEEEEEEEKPQPKKRQSRSENSKFAQMRREKEALEEENKRLKAEKDKATFEAQKGVIPKAVMKELNIDSIDDEDDMFLAKAYLEAEEKGSDDPKSDAYEALKSRLKEQKMASKKEADEKEKSRKLIEEDSNAFISKYGQDRMKAALEEGSTFMKLYGDQIGNGNLTKLYDKYVSVFGEEDENDDSKTKGSLPKGGKPANHKPKSIEDMTDKEFKEYYESHYGSWN